MRQDLEKTELGIRSVVGIMGGVIVTVAFFYTQVVIPIKEIQTRLVSIEASLQSEKEKYERFDTQLNNLTVKFSEHLINTKTIK